LNVDSDDVLYLRQAGRQKRRIWPDSVFGFVRKGVKYLYFSQEGRYMAVLNEEAPLMLVMKADVHFEVGFEVGWAYTDDTLLYTTGVGQPLEILNKENILKDFGKNGELATRLTLLTRAVVRAEYTDGVQAKDFRGCLQMVQDYLYGPLPVRRRHYPRSLL
jgi:hypothetical protein